MSQWDEMIVFLSFLFSVPAAAGPAAAFGTTWRCAREICAKSMLLLQTCLS